MHSEFSGLRFRARPSWVFSPQYPRSTSCDWNPQIVGGKRNAIGGHIPRVIDFEKFIDCELELDHRQCAPRATNVHGAQYMRRMELRQGDFLCQRRNGALVFVPAYRCQSHLGLERRPKSASSASLPGTLLVASFHPRKLTHQRPAPNFGVHLTVRVSIPVFPLRLAPAPLPQQHLADRRRNVSGCLIEARRRG